MRDAHLTLEALRAFFDRDQGEAELRLLLHHLAVCPACSAVGGYILELYEEGTLPPVFGLVDIDFALARREAPGLWSKLSPFPFARQEDLIRKTSEFRSWGLAELLCRESERAAPHDATKALELAELAVLIADLLEEWQPAEEAWLCLLRAYTWAHLGNARRVAGNLPAANEAFSAAEKWWELGEAAVGDVLDYQARLLALKASLRMAERRFPEALELLDRAIAINTDPALTARLVLNKARVFEEEGDLGHSIEMLNEASPLVDRERDPRVLLCLRHNLADNLARAGRYSEAESLLSEVKSLAGEVGGDLDRLRLSWVEGRIAAGLGERERAISHLEDVRHQFSERGIGYDAALASLELATVYLEAGRPTEVKMLARDMLPIFEASDVHREALAALSVFQHAAEAETLSIDLLHRLGVYLRAARQDPGLHFEE